MLEQIKKIFLVESMIKPGEANGAIPSSKEMYRNLAHIAIPSVIEMVFMSVIGSVDMIMLRWMDNPSTAIAAVGLATQPRMITLALFFALNVGVTAYVARRKGENRKKDANRALRNAIILIFLLSIFVMIISLIFAKPLLRLAGAKDDTIGMSHDYFRIMAYFLPVAALTLCINAAQRGVGNTRTTMYVNITSNIINAILNIFFIYGLRGPNGSYIIPAMGVAGNAWSTGTGLTVGFILCVVSIVRNKLKDKFLHLSFQDNWKLHKKTVLSILRVGGNAMVEQVAMRVGFFAYAAIIASLGTQSVAAHQVGMQCINFSFSFGDGLAVAATSLVGQMLGKKRPDLASIYGNCAQRVSLCSGIVLASLIVCFRGSLVRIFLDSSVPSNIVSYGLAVNVLLIVGLFQPLQMSNVVISGCLRGAGDNLHVALIMIICAVIIRPGLSAIAIYTLHLGLIGAWSASLIDMSIRLFLMYKRFRSGEWKLKKV